MVSTTTPPHSGGGSDRQLTSSEFHRWIQGLESGQKIVEAVEPGKKSDLRSLGPYHQESVGGSFGPNGYNVTGRNAAASQHTDEFNRSVLVQHDGSSLLCVGKRYLINSTRDVPWPNYGSRYVSEITLQVFCAHPFVRGRVHPPAVGLLCREHVRQSRCQGCEATEGLVLDSGSAHAIRDLADEGSQPLTHTKQRRGITFRIRAVNALL